MADDVVAALQRQGEALAGMGHLAAQLAALSMKVDPGGWPRPGPPKPSPWARPPRSVQGMGPAEVTRRWREGGRTWLAAADPRTLRAAAIALQVRQYAVILVTDSDFLTELLPRLRGRQLAMAVAGSVFASWPPPEIAMHALAAVRRTQHVPRWCRLLPEAAPAGPQIARALGLAVVDGEIQKPGDLDLPEGAWDGEWGAAIVRLTPVRTLEAAARQLSFADAGRELAAAAVTPAAAEALRSLVGVAERGGAPRRDVAGILRRRVGSPFGADAEAKWKVVADLLPKVRAWLAGEVLEIVFEHLTPDDREIAGMTLRRKVFWKDYTGSVRRIWIVASSSIKPQLQHPDVQRIRALMGPDLQVRNLQGGPQQALVWMHLEGAQGVITVVEGNANTSLRVCSGAVHPRGGIVYYTGDVVHGELSEAAGAYVLPHLPGWDRKAAAELRHTYGLRGQS